MKRKLSITVLMTVLAGMFLTGCGDSPSSDSKTPTPPSTNSVPSTNMPAK